MEYENAIIIDVMEYFLQLKIIDVAIGNFAYHHFISWKRCRENDIVFDVHPFQSVTVKKEMEEQVEIYYFNKFCQRQKSNSGVYSCHQVRIEML